MPLRCAPKSPVREVLECRTCEGEGHVDSRLHFESRLAPGGARMETGPHPKGRVSPTSLVGARVLCGTSAKTYRRRPTLAAPPSSERQHPGWFPWPPTGWH